MANKKKQNNISKEEIDFYDDVKIEIERETVAQPKQEFSEEMIDINAKNIFAILSIIMGSIAVVIGILFYYFLPPLCELFSLAFAIASIVLGILGSNKAKKISKGKTLSLVGTVCGTIAMILLLVFFILILFAALIPLA